MSNEYISHAEDKRRMREMFVATETMRDFLEWIFEYEVDWMTQGEALEKFEKWEEKKSTKPIKHIK